MPPASARLSIALLPADPDAPADRIAAAYRSLGEQGWLSGRLIEGGFLRARLELGPDVHFFSNWQGGFRVSCPDTGENVTAGFSRALERWRTGAPRLLACSCQRDHDLAALAYAPEAGFARGAIWLLDAASDEVDPEGRAAVERAFGPFRVILRRG